MYCHFFWSWWKRLFSTIYLLKALKYFENRSFTVQQMKIDYFLEMAKICHFAVFVSRLFSFLANFLSPILWNCHRLFISLCHSTICRAPGIMLSFGYLIWRIIIPEAHGTHAIRWSSQFSTIFLKNYYHQNRCLSS